MKPEDLCGVTEAAALLGITRQRMYALRQERDDFPTPFVELACGPIWLRRDLARWAPIRRRPPGRPKLRA